MLLESDMRWSELDNRALNEARNIEKAIVKTKERLKSQAAKDDPDYRAKLLIRLQRQNKHLDAVCSKLLYQS